MARHGIGRLRAGGSGFNPLSLFGAGEQGAWYDPSDLSSMFQDSAGTTPVTGAGQPVGKINDKSGRGNHATQATAAARPVLQVDGNGKFYLQFDGVDDFLKTGAIVLSQPLTKYARFATTSTPATTGRVIDGTGINTCAIYHPAGTLSVVIVAGTLLSSGGTAVLNTYVNAAGVFNGVSSSARMNSTSASGDAGANASSAITLGAAGTGTEFNAMRLASVIVVASAHTTPTIDSVFAYMTSKT